MEILSKVNKPFTPMMRRFVLDVFRPTATTLGKRGRQLDDENLEKPSTTETAGVGHMSNCVALQNEDTEEDAIVITALNMVPFCCHADLLMMTREQLINVAETLNSKLPVALRIDTRSSRSDVFIRNSIELLVGIRRTVPPAPNPDRSFSFQSASLDAISGSGSSSFNPVSPLASRSRFDASNLSLGTPRLAALQEEEEENVAVGEPNLKRRRILTQAMLESTPTPLRAQVSRSRTHRSPLVYDTAVTTPTRVLRSQSQKLPERKPLQPHRNITITRGRSNHGGRYRSQSTILTSTPKIRKILQPRNSDSFPVAASSASKHSGLMTHKRTVVAKAGTKRKADDMNSVDAMEVTRGIGQLTLKGEYSGSDMDISEE